MSKRFAYAALACAALMVGGISVAIADDAGGGGSDGQAPMHEGQDHDWGHGGWDGHRHGSPAVLAAMMDLHGMERLYLMEGHPKDVVALYQSVLNKTHDPILRNFIYRRLARAQLMPSDPQAAIGTLQKSLDENLDRLNSDSHDKPDTQ
ncbi:MAG TPA: hypothetical protein VGH91_00130 [Gammaproteobacteria bacterium]|jgi:hypothetical protein